MPSKDTDPDLTVEISNTMPAEPLSATSCIAYLVHIYPPGAALGTRYVLSGAPLVLGRDLDCDICINDPSVSRRHAMFQPEGDAYSLLDLNSTNGVAVNKVPITQCLLQDGDDVRIGNCIYRFLASSNVEAQYHEEIYHLTISDPLTQIPNRRFLQQFLERELLRSARYHRPLALLLFDIDHFKDINDRFGHLGGDFTLRELALCIQKVIRKEGLLARYGGEEFVVVLPEATLDIGLHVAERLRSQVENFVFQYRGKVYSLTVSLGVTATDGQEVLTSEEFLHQADENLYQAKRLGRNRVIFNAPRQKSEEVPVNNSVY